MVLLYTNLHSVAEGQSLLLLARTDVIYQTCYAWHLLSHLYLHGVYDVCGMKGHETRHSRHKWKVAFVMRKHNFGARHFQHFESHFLLLTMNCYPHDNIQSVSLYIYFIIPQFFFLYCRKQTFTEVWLMDILCLAASRKSAFCCYLPGQHSAFMLNP